jgi:hypothetical protein
LEGNINERPTLSEQDRTALGKILMLTAQEWNELEQQPYNQNDAAYLEECLLLRTAVRGLNIDNATPLVRATAGFDWVCRVVYLDNRFAHPTPAWCTLHGGSGVALSRAYVALAAWQQLGLDSCLIGPPALQRTVSSVAANDRTAPEKRTYAPVRACGVLLDGEILLFDHTSGKAIAGPGGKGIATLNQVRAEPKLAESLAPADEVKTWQPYLAVPYTSLAGRMKALEKLQPGACAVKLAVDAIALRDRLLAKHKEMPCGFWNPDGDVSSATRIVATFANEDLESATMASPRSQLRVKFVPTEILPETVLTGYVAASVKQGFGVRFERLRWSLGSPRDYQLRGMFKDATAGLMHVKGELERERSRVGQNHKLVADFDRISDTMLKLSAERERARRDNNGAKLAEASTKYDDFMKDNYTQAVLRAYIMSHATPPLTAEVMYLLAACVHERAERASLTNTKAAKADWENARDWWKRYLDASTEAKNVVPARDVHAQALLRRCDEQLR